MIFYILIAYFNICFNQCDIPCLYNYNIMSVVISNATLLKKGGVMLVHLCVACVGTPGRLERPLLDCI